MGNNRIIKGYNDLLSKNIVLASEWNYERNGSLKPDEVAYKSDKKVWWKCHICGHEWIAQISSRSRGCNCPKCGQKKWLDSFHKTKLEEKGSLSETNPLLASEWDYENNTPLLPSDVLAGSTVKVWWRCSVCDNKWQATIKSRSNGTGCPVCANKKVIKGYNDLETRKPELIAEWLYTKNSILPSEVSTGCGKKVWWRCKICGYEWQASIAQRTSGKGCPNCSSRAQTSFPEQAIFFYLKKIFPDAINRDTVLFGSTKMELDVFIPSLKIAFEYDGIAWHNSAASLKREITKYSVCKEHNIKLYRIKEFVDEENEQSKDIVADHTFFCHSHPSNKELDELISNIVAFLSKTINVDVEKDSVAIREQYYRAISSNSIAEAYPELAKEWNYDKNGRITPKMVSWGSPQSVWWKCTKGHEWKVSPSNRVLFHSGCPYCNNKKVLSGYNDLATLHPEALKAWDYEKNTDISPETIMAGNSKKKVFWKCDKGHHFSTSVYQYLQLSGNKCPVCSNKQIIKGYNDFASQYPKLALEWNYEKNNSAPTEYSKGSNKKVWWKCELNHEWQATISNRTAQGTGCPYCANKKVLVGFNDLQSQRPSLAAEWDHDKNEYSPSEALNGGSKKAWWKCSKCGYSWKTTIAERIRGRGCPACSHAVVNQGQTDFETLFPDKAKWWNNQKNGELQPSMVGPFSDKKVWWKCDKGHEYYRAIKYASRGYGCPICKKQSMN